MYVILDGSDFGTGFIHLLFAKSREDKKVMQKAAGYFYDFNEVWLIVFGGVLFFAFPGWYAAMLSGFYLLVIIFLWLIIFRGIGIEFRNQIKNTNWEDFWDACFGVSSMLILFFSGVALGNFVRGFHVNYNDETGFFLPLWAESFSPYAEAPGLFDWYTVLFGVLSVLVFAVQGIQWILLKTKVSVRPVLEKYRRIFLSLSLLLASIVAFVSIDAQPELLLNFTNYPLLCVLPAGFLLSIFFLLFRAETLSDLSNWLLSSAVVAFGLITPFAAVFPNVLPSVTADIPGRSVYELAAPESALGGAFIWVFIGIVWGVFCLVVHFRAFHGRVENIGSEK